MKKMSLSEMPSDSKTVENARKEDYLEVDAPIPGQQYVCLSFVSPEAILQQKEAYFRTAFWAYLKDNHDTIDYALASDFENEYANFMEKEEQPLEELFHEKNEFQTSVRGLKVRGTYNSKNEADVRARVLQKLDPSHHVFVAPVGYWLPWDPSADAIDDQVYQEEQLNELMKNYKQNELKRDTYYEQQKGERMKDALVENVRRHKENAENDKNRKEDTAPASDARTVFDAVESQSDHTDLKHQHDGF